jgi:hemoglobin-like flavoprotein
MRVSRRESMGVTRHPLCSGDDGLRRFPCDAALAARLRASLAPLATRGDEAARRFYERLFRAHPELRALFPLELEAQREKLAATLWAVVDGLGAPQHVRAHLVRLGADHVRYGARAEHYPPVCELLLATLVEVAGPAWSPEIEADWRTVLALFAQAMLAGARDVR